MVHILRHCKVVSVFEDALRRFSSVYVLDEITFRLIV